MDPFEQNTEQQETSATSTSQPPRMPSTSISKPPAMSPDVATPAVSMPLQPHYPQGHSTVSPQLTDDERSIGMLIHLLSMLTGVIGVLILWLVKKDQSSFIDHHGKEALNFQLTVLLVVVASLMVGMITVIGLFLAIPLVWAVGIGAFIVELMACLAANRGEWHRYPMTIRFIS